MTADTDAPLDEVEAARRTTEACRERLKKAAVALYGTIRAAGYTSGMVAVVTGLSDSTVRKLGSDGDARGWRPPSAAVCEAIDTFVRDRLEADSSLARLREELRLAQEVLEAAQARTRAAEYGTDLSEAVDAVHKPELESYLLALCDTLSTTARWLPHSRIDDGFQDRFVRVQHSPPSTANEGSSYDPGLVARGDVSWAQAVKGAPIAVVLADAGSGKSWLLNHHALQLGRRALADIGAGVPLDTVTVPLWIHARDLAECWRNEQPPGARIADGCLRPLARLGFPITRTLRRLLTERIAAGKAPACILIDAYDEVFDDGLRESANLAIHWLSASVRTDATMQIILASRPAGYADPFDHRPVDAPADEEEDDDEDGLDVPDDADPRYLFLGILNEVQVRSLWRRWFTTRGRPVPTQRLEPVLAPHSPLRQFVRVPLIAAFCAWVAEAEPVASTRTGLYAQVVRRFLALSWKTPAPGAQGTRRQDGAGRARLEADHVRLAWTMATTPRGWQDAVAVGECEEILAADRPAGGSDSHVWGPVREIGILVQPGVGPDMPLGDGPVMWIHRSVHEFLVARTLIAEPTHVIAEMLDRRCWFHPAWANVLDFALGLEPADEGRRLLLLMDRSAGDGRDGLGWFSTVMAAADLTAGAPADIRTALLDRVRLLHNAGLLSAVHMAKALSSGATGDVDEIVAALRDHLRDKGPNRALWDAFAWSGAPGRAALEEVIRTAPDTNGAAAALHQVDAAAARAAMQDRIITGLPCHSYDASALREVDAATAAVLQERYLADPASQALAETLGYTRSAGAQETLSRHDLLTHENATVRLAAASGLAAWYGNELDERGFALLRDMAVGDPDRLVRMRLRAGLEGVASSVPWVERALGTVFYDLHKDAAEPELNDLDAVAARLRSVGTGTRLAVTMVRVEPRLLRGPVPEAMAGLAARAMVGHLDAQMTADVAHIVGVNDFVAAAIARLAGSDVSEDMTRLALGICFAAPGDPAVFDALVSYAGRTQDPLIEASLHVHDLQPEQRIQRLAHAMHELTSPSPRSVQTWAYAMRAILSELPESSRSELRDTCARATGHVLSLSS